MYNPPLLPCSYFQHTDAIYAHDARILTVHKCCQTPTPGESWELTLLSHGNKKKNDPHLNSPRTGCRMVSNFSMGS
jgi:hypothetical protein